MRRTLATFAGALALALTLAGCSDSSSPPPRATTAPLPTLERPPTRTGTIAGTNPTLPAATATVAASPSPQATEGVPTAAASPAGGGDSGDVIDAAVAELGAVYRQQLSRDTCIADNPNNKPCISLGSNEATVNAGIARFTGGFPDGGGFSFYMGLLDNGDWGYWFGTQQGLYQLVALPGDLRACGGGKNVTIRQSPSGTAGSLGALPDGSTVRAEEFVLTVAGSASSQNRGEGWYRIGGGTAGWVPANQVSDASLGNCDLHDAIEGSSPRG